MYSKCFICTHSHLVISQTDIPVSNLPLTALPYSNVFFFCRCDRCRKECHAQEKEYVEFIQNACRLVVEHKTNITVSINVYKTIQKAREIFR